MVDQVKVDPRNPWRWFCRNAPFNLGLRLCTALKESAGSGSLRKWALGSELSIVSPWRVPKFGKGFFEPQAKKV